MSIELSLRGVRARYGQVEVLHGIDLDFPAGSITALLGPNGAGKSTMLNVIAGTMPTSSGSILWRGKEVERCSAYERARRGMMLVPERRGIFPDLTVADNLAVFSDSGELDLDSALTTFPILRDRQTQRAGSLSGGEQQMLAMSRVLIQQPSLLLLDEISFGLAPQVTAALFDVVSGLAEAGTTIVLVEQYVAEATRLADVVYVLARGQVAFAGDAQEATAADQLPGYAGSTR